MKLRYYSEFKSRKDKTYRIEIHTVFATYSEELTLTDSPFTVEYESDTLYKPLKMSNSVTSILTDKILSDLYTAEGQNIEVRLYNKTDDVLEWFGYMSPNLYSSDYITPLNIVEIQAIDTISVLENKKYSYINSSEVYFKSFKDVIMHILDIADPGKILNKLYFQKTNRISKDVSTSLIEDIYIHERNFFDEANEPMNSRDVLEEISKYIGMTFIQYQDAYYRTDGGCHPCTAFHISDFTFKYTNNKVTYDIFNNAVDDSDVVYSNVINDNNVTEMDDIELLINSNAKNISSYSNCATKSGDKFDYLKTVYSPLHDKNVLPEQILIDKFYTHYKAPKFRYSNNLNRGFSILSRIYENSLKREMVVDQMSIDYANESCNVSLIET